MKRICILKAAVIAALLLAQGAFAQKPDINWFAKNSEAETFHISTADELAGLVKIVDNTAGVGQAFSFNGKTIVLANDIDLSKYGANYNSKKGWVPIGSGSFPFSGTFDGNGKKVKGLYINDKERKYVGLFGYVKDGSIKNLGVENVNITGIGFIGSIVGYFESDDEKITKISNCYSTGKLTSPPPPNPRLNYYYYLGGIAGSIGKNSIIDSSYSSAVINGQQYVGGIAGSVRGSKISNSYSTGTISGEYDVGGVAGKVENGSSIIASYSTGIIKGNNSVGGVAGNAEGGDFNYGGYIYKSYSTGAISGKSYVGGVVGNAYKKGSVSNSYSTGIISGDNYVGGVSGYGTVRHSYATGVVKGKEYVGGVTGYGYVVASYSTSTVSGVDKVGGISGYGTVNNSIALNPSVKATGKDFGRIVGNNDESSRNLAFNGMTNNAGNTLWLNKAANSINGIDIANVNINADGTLGGRFEGDDWTIEDGKLPGIGKAVDMPAFLLADAALVEAERAKQIWITDTRDGKKYRGVKIGNQVWMAENLNYEAEGSRCYNDSIVHCKKYGRLYNWETAMEICPQGWHLPSVAEWDVLHQFVDGVSGKKSPYKSQTAGIRLRAYSETVDNYHPGGEDTHGFKALLGGSYLLSYNFNGMNSSNYWWSSLEDEKDYRYAYGVSYTHNEINWNNDWGNNEKLSLFSVRCLEGEPDKSKTFVKMADIVAKEKEKACNDAKESADKALQAHQNSSGKGMGARMAKDKYDREKAKADKACAAN